MNRGIDQRRRSRRSAFWAAVALVVCAGAPAQADDTELFVATSSPRLVGAQPNVLFVIDTSGSMLADVLTQAAWDPTVAWEGCYQRDAVYFSTTTTRPSCESNDWFEASSNFCQDSRGPLAGVGAYSGRLKAWREGRERWVDLNGDQKSRSVECENDAGIHGGGDDRLWAANGPSGPWQDGPDLQPAWNQQYYLWDGNWLNWSAGSGTVTRERLDIVKDVAKQLLDNIDGVNVGLMRFNFDEGGPVLEALGDVATNRADLESAIDALPASGWTPLSETLFEAGQYFAGRQVVYGDVEEPRSDPDSRVGGDPDGDLYATPVTAACQKNYIVILTDGAPSQDTGAQSRIEALPEFAALVGPACDGGTEDGACLDDMAEYLHKRDLNSTLPGLQNVTTHTIGFAVDLPLLRTTAERGGGDYFTADDTSSLAGALTEIMLSILDDSATFTAPSVPVNVFNRTQNLGDVYVSVFEPSGTMHWPGNLKKYGLSGGRLTGRDGRPAVDPATGFFREDAHSFWSPEPDGDRAAAGGAASRLPDAASRRLYTDIAGAPLSAAGNAIAPSNASLTADMIGAPAGERDRVIAWLRGLDVLDDDDDGSVTDTRRQMGDPLHVRPVTVIYGGTAEAPDAVVFTATNDGQLHAFDADNGVELWAYTPSRLLGRIYELYLDDPTPTKRYGLDSDIRVHVLNDDGIPGISGGERVILVFGMRRGGDSVFALDVTDRNAPVRLWEVNANSPGFADLGQTWSTPVVADVSIGGTRRTVALFGGGYDEGQDNPGYRTDTIGNAVFMVDALTGAKLWSAGSSDAEHQLVLPRMRHSIPAPLTVLDINQDGLADRMYVGDMGGRVWRFDIVNGAAAGALVEGGVLASLGAAHLPSPPPPGEVRRFYAAPDVVPVVTRGRYFLTVNLGSGFRAHPLDTTVRDEFFSIRDYRVNEVIDSDGYPTPLTRTALVDVTNDANPELLPTDRGWRLRMVQSAGEKILNRSTTFQNSVFFTSFSPGISGERCVAASGLNRLYQVDVRTGGAVTNLDGSIDGPDDPLTESDRYRSLRQGGIAPEVIFLFPEDAPDVPVACIGAECLTPEVDNRLIRTYWTQEGA
jgi:type IV pilus assembly protein PilY1